MLKSIGGYYTSCFSQMISGLWADKMTCVALKAIDPSFRSSPVWDCISIDLLEDGGSVSKFAFKFKSPFWNPSQFNSLIEKTQEEIFPASEVDSMPIHFDGRFPLNGVFFEQLKEDKLERNVEFHAMLEELGYKFEYGYWSDHLTLPDRQALEMGWEKYRLKHPDLPLLEVVDSDGVATDADFINTLLKKGGLLSLGKEFVHDHTIHLIRLLISVFTERNNYAGFKERFVAAINLFYLPYQEAQKKGLDLPYDRLIATIGLMLDVLLAIPHAKIVSILRLSPIEQFEELYDISIQPRNVRYLQKRFKLSCSEEIECVWDRMLLTYYAAKAGFSEEEVNEIASIKNFIAPAVFLLSELGEHSAQDLEILETELHSYRSLHRKYQARIKAKRPESNGPR